MRSPRLRPKLSPWLVCFFVLIFAVIGTAAEPWQKYESDHLTVYSNCAPYRAKSLIRHIAAHQSVMRQLLAPAGAPFPHTTLVYFSDQEDFNKYAPMGPYLQALTCWKAVGRNLLLATAWDGNIDARIESLRIIDSSLLLSWYVEALPNWLRYTLVSPFVKMKQSQEGVAFAPLSRSAVALLKKEKWEDWNTLVTSRESIPISDGTLKGDQPVRYAQLTLLGHWLAFGHHRTPGIQSLISAFRDTTFRGATPPTLIAFETALGMDTHELDKQLRAHLEGLSNGEMLPFDRRAYEAELKISVAPEYELQIQFYEMLAGSKSYKSAGEILDRAIASGAQSPDLIMARARRALRENEREQVVSLCREAIAAGSQDPLAYLYSAEGRLGQVFTDYESPGNSLTTISKVLGMGGTDIDLCLEELRAALRLDPVFLYAYNTFGRALFAAPAVTRAQAEELTPGIAENARGLDVRYLRGIAYWRAGARSEAEADLDYLIQHHPTKSSGQQAEDWLRTQQRKEVTQVVDKLLIQDRYVEAREAVEQARDRKSYGLGTGDYNQLMERINEKQAWDMILACFREKLWLDLDQTSTEFIKNYPKSKRLPAVRKMQVEAQSHL